MKYWRGYLVAAIFAVFTGAITAFAKANATLIDMIYPYVTRIFVSYLSDWTAGASFCLWQLLVLLLIAAVVASIILMILLKWNPVQWLGWILAAASCLSFLHTGVYGLNYYAGSIADDIRLEVTDYTVSELNAATVYYMEQANRLAQEINRDENGDVKFLSFEELAQQAGEGFTSLTYDRSYPIFSGSSKPVKKLSWSQMYLDMGITGVTVNLTGEAAVNPQIPDIALPFTMCHEMAHRMSIATESDANMAAFLACSANSSAEFQYSAYFMAFRYCYNALDANTTSTAQACINQIDTKVNKYLLQDMESYDAFYNKHIKEDASTLANSANDAYLKASGDEAGTASYTNVTNLLVSWYVQELVIPQYTEDEEDIFDPLDPNQVDLTGIVNAGA